MTTTRVKPKPAPAPAPPPARENIRANLIVARAQTRLTQAQLADAAGVTRQTISDLERGVVANDVTRWGLDNSDFEPTLRTILAEIRLSPRSFPVKHDELDGARSAHVAFRGKTWCVVYDVDEDYFEVMVLSIEPHDVAYRKAARRRR